MKTGRKIGFIINSNAGGFNKNYIPLINDFFNNKDSEAVIILPESKVAVQSDVQNAIKAGCDSVIAVGGDGTVNIVGQALLGSNASLGILPLGSGNGLARHHKIPMNFRKALEVIYRNNTVDHDYLRINNHISFNVSGIGFDAHVAHLFGRNGQRGFKNYIKLTITEFKNYNNYDFVITESGKAKSYNAMMISIANSSQFGNNAHIAPAALTNDGKLNLTIVKKMSAWKFPAFAIRVFRMSISKSSYAELLEGENFNIKCKNIIPLHIDGEPAGFDDTFSISVQRSGFRLIVP